MEGYTISLSDNESVRRDMLCDMDRLTKALLEAKCNVVLQGDYLDDYLDKIMDMHYETENYIFTGSEDMSKYSRYFGDAVERVLRAIRANDKNAIDRGVKAILSGDIVPRGMTNVYLQKLETAIDELNVHKSELTTRYVGVADTCKTLAARCGEAELAHDDVAYSLLRPELEQAYDRMSKIKIDLSYDTECVSMLTFIKESIENMLTYKDVTIDKTAISLLGRVNFDHIVSDIEVNLAILQSIRREIEIEVERVKMVHERRAQMFDSVAPDRASVDDLINKAIYEKIDEDIDRETHSDMSASVEETEITK